MNEMKFSMSDLYPNFNQTDTSTMVTPEPDDQDALNEDTAVAEESKANYARGKNLMISAGVLIALIVFLGGAK